MSISIEPTDFSQDIIDTIKPILEALGLLDSQGKLDLNDWSLEKALGLFATFERTDSILNLVSGFLKPPKYVYRDSLTGFVSRQQENSTDVIEEWFEFYSFSDVALGTVSFAFTIISEKKSDTLDDGQHCQFLKVGLGVSIEDIPVDSQQIDTLLSIPIIELESSPPSNLDDYADITKTLLLWHSSGAPKSRISLSAGISPDSGNYSFGSQSCDSISLSAAIGKGAGKVVISLDNFQATENDIPSDFVIDVWSGSGGFLSNILNQIIPTILQALPSGRLKDHIVPMLGLEAGTNDPVDWPILDVVGIFSNLSDADAILNEVRLWFEDMATNHMGGWFGHLYELLTGITTVVDGSGTLADPWSFPLIDIPPISLCIQSCSRTDSNGIDWIDFGVLFSVSKFVSESRSGYGTSDIEISGNFDTWLLSIPFSSSSSIDVLYHVELNVEVKKDDGSHLLTWSDSLGGALGGHVNSARLALRLDSNRNLIPAVELIGVQLGATTWPVVDLTTSDFIDEALDALLLGLQDTISDSLADGGILQRLCSLVGLVSPRNTPFRADMYIKDKMYAVGDWIQDAGQIWEVTTAGECDADPIDFAYSSPTQNQIETLGSSGNTIEIKYIGSRASLSCWETGDANDLRIDLVELVTNPLPAIARYHQRLLSTSALPNAPSNLAGIPPWVFLFEAIGDIVKTAINAASGDQDPPILGSESLVPSYSSSSNPETYSYVFNPGAGFPEISMEAKYDNTNRNLSLNLCFCLAEKSLRPGMYLTVIFGSELALFSLPEYANSNDESVSAELLTGAIIEASLSNLNPNGTGRLDIFNIGGMRFSIEKISAGIEWTRGSTPSIGGSFDIVDPILGTMYPDLSEFFTRTAVLNWFSTNSSNIDLLAGLSWNGTELRLPDGSLAIFDGTDVEFYDPQGVATSLVSPSSLSFQLSNGTPSPNDLNIETTGLSCSNSKISFQFLPQPSSLSGLWNDFLPMPTISTPIDIFSESLVQHLVGNFLALKCGRIGFFVTGFFRLNPNLLYMDLSSLLNDSGVELDDYSFPEIPSSWSVFRGLHQSSNGLGPFSLPLDWPALNWNDLLADPFTTFKTFIVNLFNGVSNSGEPFALPALRWIWGLLSNNLPDLRLPDLGWSVVEGGDGPSRVSFPDIPLEIEGAGLYDDPWAICLSIENLPKIELLVWLDPDGLPRPNGLQELYGHLSSEIMGLLQQTVTVTNSPNMPYEWPEEIAEMLLQLKNLSPRISHSIGNMTKEQIADSLIDFDSFMKESDGFTTVDNQLDPMGDWALNTGNAIHSANHFNALRTPSVIDESIQFIQDVLQSNTPTSWKFVLVSPDWMEANPWSDFITQATTIFPAILTGSLPDAALDFSNQGIISKTQVEMTDLSNHDASRDFHLLTPTFESPSSDSCEEHLATQLKVLVEHITADGSMVFIVGHSLGGLAVRYYSEGKADLGVEPDSKVFGALTIATPHDIVDPDYEEKLRHVEMVVHLLRLIGAVDHDYAIDPASVPLAGAAGPSNMDHIPTEALKQLAAFLMDTDRSLGFEEVVA